MHSRLAQDPVLHWFAPAYVHYYIFHVIYFYLPPFKNIHCLYEWKFGYEVKVPFTGEQYESVLQAMVSLMEQLDGHKYHGLKFKKLCKRIATDSQKYGYLFHCLSCADFHYQIAKHQERKPKGPWFQTQT